MTNRTDRRMTVLGWTLAVGLVLGVLVVVAAAALAGSMEHATIRIDGEPIDLAALGAEHWAIAIAGAAIALFVVVLVVPFAVLVPLAIAAFALVAGALALASLLAVVLSPLILVGLAAWLIVRGVRRGRGRASTMPS